jgi:hypothetical protein
MPRSMPGQGFRMARKPPCSGLFVPSLRRAAAVRLFRFACFANAGGGRKTRLSFGSDSMSGKARLR